jgi:uncharacterized repeat protein (TIGR03806 family)
MPRSLPLAALLLSLAVSTALASDARQPVRKPFGLEKRVPWTTSNVVGYPEPPPPYRTERVFPKLSFAEPLDFAAAPGTNRIWVAERRGKLHSFVQKADVEKADLALELTTPDKNGQPQPQTIYGFTFHPKFKENGYVYVTWIPDGSREGIPTGSRVSRFTAKGEPPVIARDSEKVIIEWPNGGHNGGCLKFGPDGMLYIVTGDGSGIADELQIGQDLSSILGKILRIDVDQPAEGHGYSIPQDNPFVRTRNARPETWAYGLRQFWRFGFDRASGDLWGGEIGQDLWESVHRIQKGGNYGWSVMEGTHPFRPERKKGPTPILKPIVEHSHSDFRSITGGFIYRGKRLRELAGHYIYGDFDTGRIWAFQPVSRPVTREGRTAELTEPLEHRELARTTYRLITFAEDAAGELLILDFTGGGLHQLVKAPPVEQITKPFPTKLSRTGLFASTKDHTPAPGLIPYSVNAQLWSDHAIKERFIAIPGDAKIGLDEVTYPQPSPGAPPGWKFPDGTVLVKTFSMEMERGNPASAKRLETRLLHFQKFPGTEEYGDQYWRGYTYVWNDEQTDAELLEEKGADKLLKIKVGDKLVEQNYRFPSRAECTLCHTMGSKFALGVTTMQMNKDHNYGGTLANQLATLDHIGLFDKPLPKQAEELPKLANYDDESADLDTRARAYLHSNCAHCHIKWGGGNAEFKLVSTLPLADLGIVNVNPGHGRFNLDDPKLLVPGQPDRSIILHRMQLTTLGRMPHIGSRVPHESAIKLIREWIAGLR